MNNTRKEIVLDKGGFFGHYTGQRLKKEGLINTGLEEIISMLDFTKLILKISIKAKLNETIGGSFGVQGRCSYNNLISRYLTWFPCYSLEDGLKKLNPWILSLLTLTKKF